MTTTFSSLKQNKTGETNKQWKVESKFLKDIHNQNHHFETTLTLGNRDITRVVGTSHIYGTVLILQTPTFGLDNKDTQILTPSQLQTTASKNLVGMKPTEAM